MTEDSQKQSFVRGMNMNRRIPFNKSAIINPQSQIETIPNPKSRKSQIERYFPVNTGSRFSRKAVNPSTQSLDFPTMALPSSSTLSPDSNPL